MNLFLWIVAALLAALFLASGVQKVLQPSQKLASSSLGQDFSAGTLKTIGVLELLAAIGLILPAALDIAPVLVPVAALGLALLMLGAAITHARRKEPQAIAVVSVLLILSLVIVWGRF
jgi:uncharacterized membrane protein YphA (DoxX/SURF4 family)